MFIALISSKIMDFGSLQIMRGSVWISLSAQHQQMHFSEQRYSSIG